MLAGVIAVMPSAAQAQTGNPAALTLISGNSQSANVSAAYALPLVLKVTDAAGEPVAGAQVTFSGPGSGATAFLDHIYPITGADGRASVTATANHLPGPFTLSASVGGVATTAVFALTNTDTSVVPASAVPTVSVIYPPSGAVGGGTAVTITGTGFTAATAVTVGGAAVTDLVVLSDTRITATTPAGVLGTASVVVTRPSGSNAANSLFSYDNVPVITWVTITDTLIGPLQTPNAHRYVTTLSGRNFTGVTDVGFRSPTQVGYSRAPGSFIVQDDNTIINTHFFSDSGSTGYGDGTYIAYFQVSTPQVSSEGFRYVSFSNPPPLVISQHWRTIQAGYTPSFPFRNNFGYLVVIDPTEPVKGSCVLVQANDPNTGELGYYSFRYTPFAQNLKPAFVDAFQLTIALPSLPPPSPPSVKYVVAVYVFVTNTSPVLKPAAPIAITNAPVARSVKIDDLASDPDGDPLSFVATPVATPAGCGTVARVSDTEMTFTPAAGYVGACSVAFAATDGVTGVSQTEAGAAVSMVPAAGTVVFNITADPAAPTLTAMTPATGPAAGGTAVTLTGTGFTGATAVTFAGIAAPFTVVSDTQVTATTPAGAGGPASVVVTTPLGANPANTLFSYARPPSGIAVVSGSPQSANVSAAYALPLVLKVTDATGAPVAGAQVTFSGPGSGATAFLDNIYPVTGTDGRASVTATANNLAGSFTLTASVGGVATPAAFTLTNTPPPAAPPSVNITVLPGGNVALLATGVPGQSYEIQRSTDLQTWSLLTTATALADGTLAFTDTSPPAGGKAFYRTVIP